MEITKTRSLVMSLGAFVVLSGLLFGTIASAITTEPTENTNENENTNSNTNSSTPFSTVSACMKAAISKRDTALITKFETYSEAIVALIGQRRNELSTAWNNSNTTERKAALKAAWKKYQQQRFAVRKTWRDGRKATWNTYKTERKACRTSKYSTDDGQGEGIDVAI